ncbi:MAG: glycerol-3-phosphate 1-O-acyltransferase PlsY [Hyphomicrobiaceae bacterium]
MPETATLLSLLIGYLLGAIPFGLVLTRAAGLGDIRKVGSGNIGATNVLRTGNKGLAAATLLLDALKGTAGVLLPAYLFGGDAGLWGGLAAFLGHLFPVWLGFKGGKGVATYIGVLLGAAWPLALVFCGVWLLIAAVLRFSSLAALTAAVATPLAALSGIAGTGSSQALALVTLAMTALVLVRHHANIRRLLAGSEPRIGAKKSHEDAPAAGS